MFFEQYDHEPALAVLRYLMRFSASAGSQGDRIRELEEKARQALGVMNQRLTGNDWIAGPFAAGATIADLALYPYTRLCAEIGLVVRLWPAVERWLERIEAREGFLPVYADAASEVLTFEEYFTSAPAAEKPQ